MLKKYLSALLPKYPQVFYFQTEYNCWSIRMPKYENHPRGLFYSLNKAL